MHAQQLVQSAFVSPEPEFEPTECPCHVGDGQAEAARDGVVQRLLTTPTTLFFVAARTGHESQGRLQMARRTQLLGLVGQPKAFLGGDPGGGIVAGQRLTHGPFL
jgi:hypothetical protein